MGLQVSLTTFVELTGELCPTTFGQAEGTTALGAKS